MKQLKKLWVIALAAFMLAGCGFIGELIKDQVTKVGSELCGVPVGVEEVNLELLRGAAEIKGLTVANPQGYKNQNAFQMDLVRLNIGVLSLLLREQPIVVDEIVIDSPVLNLELSPRAGSNLKEIANNASRNVGKADEKAVEAEPPEAGAPREPHRIAVGKLVIKGVIFNLRRRNGTTHSGTLPTIQLTGVGGEQGKTPGGLGMVVVVAMTREALKEAWLRGLLEKAGGMKHRLAEGGWEPFSTERVVAALKERIELTLEQQTKLRTVVGAVVLVFNQTIRRGAQRDFLDPKALQERFEAAAQKAEDKLREFLNSDQVREIRARFKAMVQEAMDKVRQAAVHRLARLTGLSPEQIGKLGPILREEIEKRSALLNRFAGDPNATFKDFIKDYQARQEKTRRKLRDVLTPAQMKALIDYQDGLKEKIKDLFASIN